jgi:alkanesulfonate monooxygenase SsuD/methylene tetrahydromethanopterin reductase-like flavin-dependent oxidoreductase (luciferase family)
MEFGYVNLLEQPPGDPYADLLDELREQAVLCDQGAWDHLWLGEHHFGVSGRDNTPNPFMVAADLGARTTRLRLGIAVVVLPLWHPLRAAENIALLDQMLRGRVEIGLGRASQPHEVATFNPAADPRNEQGSREVFAESLSVVRKALTEEFFSHQGKHYQLPPPGVTWASREGVDESPEWISDGQVHHLHLVPRPYQQPHPPLWMAVSTEPSVRVVADLGIKPIVWRQGARMIKHWVDSYGEVLAEKGRGKPNPADDWAVLRNIYVAPTMAEARRDYEEVIMGSLRYRAADPWRALQAHLEPGEEMTDEMTLDFDFLQNRSMLCGTPDFVADKLAELESTTGIQTLLAGVGTYGLPHKKLMRCLDLFTDRVIPEVRKASAPAASV